MPWGASPEHSAKAWGYQADKCCGYCVAQFLIRFSIIWDEVERSHFSHTLLGFVPKWAGKERLEPVGTKLANSPDASGAGQARAKGVPELAWAA